MQLDEEARRIFAWIDEDHLRAEHYLLNFKAEWNKYKLVRHAYVSHNGRHNELESHNPTERMAIRGAEFDRRSEKFRWLRAVKIIERSMKDDERAFLEARRAAANSKGRNIRSGRPGWVVKTQQEYFSRLEKMTLKPNESWLSEQQVKRWWKRIVSCTADIAVRLKE